MNYAVTLLIVINNVGEIPLACARVISISQKSLVEISRPLVLLVLIPLLKLILICT